MADYANSGDETVFCKKEAELAELTMKCAMFLEELGIDQAGLDRLIKPPTPIWD